MLGKWTQKEEIIRQKWQSRRVYSGRTAIQSAAKRGDGLTALRDNYRRIATARLSITRKHCDVEKSGEMQRNWKYLGLVVKAKNKEDN